MVRALYQGPAAADPHYRGVLADALQGLVVVRDDEARPPREPLPLRLPGEMAEQAQAAAREQLAQQEAQARGGQQPPENGRSARN